MWYGNCWDTWEVEVLTHFSPFFTIARENDDIGIPFRKPSSGFAWFALGFCFWCVSDMVLMWFYSDLQNGSESSERVGKWIVSKSYGIILSKSYSNVSTSYQQRTCLKDSRTVVLMLKPSDLRTVRDPLQRVGPKEAFGTRSACWSSCRMVNADVLFADFVFMEI